MQIKWEKRNPRIYKNESKSKEIYGKNMEKKGGSGEKEAEEEEVLTL